MRTTLTLDDDLARRLKDLQHRERRTFRETVNDVIRRGLASHEPASDPPFRVETFDGGFAPGVDPAKLNQLLDELDADDLLAESAP